MDANARNSAGHPETIDQNEIVIERNKRRNAYLKQSQESWEFYQLSDQKGRTIRVSTIWQLPFWLRFHQLPGSLSWRHTFFLILTNHCTEDKDPLESNGCCHKTAAFTANNLVNFTSITPSWYTVNYTVAGRYNTVEIDTRVGKSVGAYSSWISGSCCEFFYCASVSLKK